MAGREKTRLCVSAYQNPAGNPEKNYNRKEK